MSNAQITRESLILINEARSPRTLSEAYRLLGGQGKLSGSVAKKMREMVPGIEAILAKNKAGTAKAEGPVVPTKSERGLKGDKKTVKHPKSSIPRHPKNPFREGSGYGLLVDLLAHAGSKGIGKPELIQAYAKTSGKDEQHSKYDLAVLLSASTDSEKKHRSCRDGFSILREGDHLQIRFD